MLVDLRGLADRVEAEAMRKRAQELEGIMHDAEMSVGILKQLVQDQVETFEAMGEHTDRGRSAFKVIVKAEALNCLMWAAANASDLVKQARAEFDGLLKAH